jgi:hypothetical protein
MRERHLLGEDIIVSNPARSINQKHVLVTLCMSCRYDLRIGAVIVVVIGSVRIWPAELGYIYQLPRCQRMSSGHSLE